MRLQRVLIANRGEIAIRLINSCNKLAITSIAIYTEEDASSMHVRCADEAYQLSGTGSRGYLDASSIIRICNENRIDAVIPGYGFLSENAEFAECLRDAGVLFVGPGPDTLKDFGLKDRARELAIRVNVPVLPGTELIESEKEAERQASILGFPLMVKATAGGGGMGLQVCHNIGHLRQAIGIVKSRGEALFSNSGFFLERFVESGRHIEAQIFGDGRGNVLFFGERECSVQRRHQKVIEESPSPFVLKHPGLRQKIKEAAVKLAASVKYKSAGTVEFLVDDDTAEFYFLEMNTRLQVEHGISELCFQVDLVEMMLRQADEELKGNLGLSDAQLEQYQRFNPTGHAIELRIYAENPAKAFRPAPGLLQHVQFPTGDKIRVDTWVETGTEVSSSFDPLLAKLMVHDQDRSSAIATIYMALSKTILKGPPTNTSYLAKILQCPDFLSGFTTTNMLATRFTYQPAAIEFVEPGAYTSVQDWPGRRNIPNGVPRSGPMDDFSFRVANLLVGNDEGTAGFEITLFGPTIIFHSAATIALCGAEFEFKVNGQQAPTWTRFDVEAGSEVAIGEPKAGARGYLAIKGGLPNVAEYLGSKSTTPSVNWGGHQGRCIRAGDFLFLDDSVNAHEAIRPPLRLPKEFRPVLENAPEVYALPGPFFDSEYLADGSEFLQNSTYTVSFQSSRNSIRLDGPPPLWSRSNGGEGGSHPSNMVGYGSTVGGVSFTGDLGLTFMLDAGNTTGFITTHTVPEVDLRRLAQLKPGEKVRYRAISWKQARELAERLESHLQKINAWVKSKNLDATITTLDWGLPHEAVGNGVLLRRDETGDLPTLTVRQSGDHAVLCILGDGTFTVPIRARLQQLSDLIRNHPPYGFLKHCSTENASILIFFDPHLVTQTSVLNTISSIEASITQTLQAKIPSRIIHLPAIFDAEECHQTIQRYMTLQRPYAAYLPDNVDFIRRSNGLLSKDQLKKSFFEVPLLVNMVGNLMGLPLYIPIDPRLRLNVPKYNPSRTYTKAGSLGIGGNTCSIYPHDSPGGYMLFGMTLPGCCWDTYGRKIGFKPEKPWLFEEFDQIIFHEVGREEYDDAVRRFEAGTYEIQIEKVEFDMLAYNELVRNTTHEVRQIKLVQEICTRKENEREAELYEKWGMEKAEAVANAKPRNPGPLRENSNHVEAVATMAASVWKVEVAVGDVVQAGTPLMVLEAMKMEISVQAPTKGNRFQIEAILKEAGEKVDAGEALVIMSKVS